MQLLLRDYLGWVPSPAERQHPLVSDAAAAPREGEGCTVGTTGVPREGAAGAGDSAAGAAAPEKGVAGVETLNPTP